MEGTAQRNTGQPVASISTSANGCGSVSFGGCGRKGCRRMTNCMGWAGNGKVRTGAWVLGT
jgi:hypothetical protein